MLRMRLCDRCSVRQDCVALDVRANLPYQGVSDLLLRSWRLDRRMVALYLPRLHFPMQPYLSGMAAVATNR